MSVGPGSRLGPYEVTALLGEGGMGQVWRAKDPQLGREIALKVLPEGLTQDPERLQRFEREARLLAQLNHPNVAHLYGLESSGQTRALVMELVEGPTLSERLAHGPLPVPEALAIASQIAQALEEAHEKGIVHRDLKPQNVKVCADGRVKVLDFGLAKAVDPASVASGSASGSQLANSPTLTLGGTQMGVILGTAAYMSPEQAKGMPVDKRADVWAFGVVLYEMLRGARLFDAPTVPETLAQVLTKAPDLEALPAATPASIRSLLRRCLERSIRNRLHDVADARLVIEDALSGRAEEAAGAAVARRPSKNAALLVAVALASAAAGHLATGVLGTKGSAPPASFERLTFQAGHFINARFAPDQQTVFLSADWTRPEREIFQVRPGAGELPIGLAGYELLSVSNGGELAVMLPRPHSGSTYTRSGTLALVSASGGKPRQIAEDVFTADFGPDGKDLAVLRLASGKWRLEYPRERPSTNRHSRSTGSGSRPWETRWRSSRTTRPSASRS